ncbi:diguanylate cyclase [Sphingomonas sp. AP4-R1]|uniref:sensor domain-containing diguanylate cyclase n=1 Tax=Sphingomonas sp. AP4-R1 TaxID=2735134 RepID=UPI00149330F4|nr:diguanylate cyclase [Sphingomonas sp. AP4-R1]QJU57483.1 diguanylate cyclase [Sphingomonas sp. AP4-R1]
MVGGEIAGRRWRLACISACLFFLAALASEFVATQASNRAGLWPANGILLGLLIARGRDGWDRFWIIAGAVLGNFASAFLLHEPRLLILLFPIANVVEAGGAALLVALFGGISGAFERIRDVLVFAVACTIAPVFSSVLGAAGLHWALGAPFPQTIVNWYSATCLSLAIVAPAVIVISRLIETGTARDISVRRLVESVLLLGLVAGTAFLIFFGTRLPILFLMLPVVLFATFRMRQLGAVVSIVIVATIAARATAEGHGPIAVHGGVDGAGHLLMLQFFLAVTFLSSLPVAAALTQSDRRGEEAYLLADHFKTVVENIGEVIFRTDRKGRWTYLNPAWEALTGYTVARSEGRSWLDWVEESERAEFSEWAQPVLDGDVRNTRRLLRFRTLLGEVRWMELSIQALRDSNGMMAGTTGTLRDIDDRKKLEEHVMSAKRRAEEQAREATLLASTDELTGLANRRAFLRHLERQVEAANEFGWALAVAIFDVDHFKLVNDSYGHAIGDRVLQLVANRAISVVRSGDLVGRLGGEEFAILMPGANPEDATVVAERLRGMIERPGDAGAEILPTVTVSVGIAAHSRGQDPAELLAGADRALYAAKSGGRNRVKLAA